MTTNGDTEARFLGAGLLFSPAVPRLLEARPEAIDYLSVIPDVLQVDRGRGRRRRDPFFGMERFADIESLVDLVSSLSAGWPIVGHGVSLSIGSPGPLDRAVVDRMAWWTERLRLRWYSEHLSFFRLPRSGTAAHEAGLAVPLPLDRDVMRAVASRAARVQRVIGVPFLLENGVTYVQPVDDDLEEHAFLGEVSRRAGTGILLDLHNVYTNARNHGFDPAAYVDALDARHVVEIHVAGGEDLAGMYTDAHSTAVPDPVWALLDRVLPRATNLRGVTFEFHESCLPRLGVAGVIEQVVRAREALARAGRPATATATREAHGAPALPESSP